jgi:hypothetical protein
MKTKAELLERHAKELEKLESEQAIRATLPEQYQEDALITLHTGQKPHANVKLWNDFRTEKRLVDALPILESYKGRIVQGEHWKAGCVSTWPAQINSVIDDQNAVMDGSHEVEIHVSGGRHYGPTVSLKFWTTLAGWLCEIQLPVSDLWKLVPRVNASYNQGGELCRCEITWPVEKQTVDKFRSFWSEKPSYSGSYYLADLPNFESFVSNFTRATKEAA